MTLNDLLKEKNLTAYALVQMTGLAPRTVYKFANDPNLNTMPLLTAAKIARALHMSIDELYGSIFDNTADLQEGWNTINRDFAVLVKDGKLIRGIQNDRPVSPYLANPEQGYDLAEGVSIDRFPEVRWF